MGDLMTADLIAGRFALEREVGRGASGRVFAARDLELERRVAIKLIGCHPGTRKLQRFRREAHALACLDHVNVLRIYDARLDGQNPFLVTELLEGQTLHERLDGRPLPFLLVLDLAAQLACGLAAAHEKGVIHRDLKPSNLFVTSEGVLKILDFGIARSCAERSLPDAASTEEGAILGTVGYMAPEQVRGRRGDARSDIFAAGCVLFEMISGRRCFSRPIAIDTAFSIVHEDPARLPEGTPRWFARIVSRSLEKRPALRFQDGRELASALRESAPNPSRTARMTAANANIPDWVRVMGNTRPRRVQQAIGQICKAACQALQEA